MAYVCRGLSAVPVCLGPLTLYACSSILKGVVTDIQGVAGVSADHQLREEGAHVMERVERLVHFAPVVSMQ